MQQDSKRAPGDLVFGLILVAASLVLVHQAWSIAGFSSLSSAGVFPMLAAGTMAVSGLVAVAQTARRKGGETGGFLATVIAPRIILFAAITTAYMIALQPLGFIVSSFLFLFAGITFLWRGNVIRAAVISAVAVAVVYVLFRYVFVVVLPRGAFF